MDDEKRFWRYIDKKGEHECWNWKGGKCRGYGIFWLQGKSYQAHRVMYEYEHLCVPRGMMVLHTCDNPSCVNPDHLKLGNHQDNMDDRSNKGRQSKGEDRYSAKLTEEDVRLIRSLYLEGYTQGYIAGKFGIHTSNVSLIVRKKHWKEVV
ncbi:MAG: hypothetical protein QG588_2390 [Candidatus Poribacteria bacterium]|nr:hypothetical protein [Candidatus Poribacteria bacterium]